MSNITNKKTVIIALSVILVIFLAAAGFYLAGERGDSAAQGSERVVIPPGASAWKTAEILHNAGLIRSPERFVMHLRIRGLTDRIKAGTYDIPRSASMSSMAVMLAAGREALAEVTIPEGWTAAQIAGLLDRTGVCDSTAFMRAVEDTVLAGEIGLGGATLEGYLFPETYSFRFSSDPREVVRTMTATFRAMVGEDWLRKAREDSLGLEGVVILASIVQGEYQLEEEAPEIAALYRNRLRKNWKLQADPTIQYLLPGGPRRILLKDLKIDSPYNTYMYRGLPPGPICNPGLTALNAALFAPERPWLFMVARGDGGHTFTTNGADHAREKAKFDKLRRETARKKKQSTKTDG